MVDTAAVTMPAAFCAPAVSTSVFTSVEVHHDVAPVLEAWAELEACAPCSIYQTRAWLLPWLETLGKKARVKPFFLLARDRSDRPIAFFPLGLLRRGPMRVAVWLGGKDANFAQALISPGTQWSRTELLRLLRTGSLNAHGKPDVLMLANQPAVWNGHANPLHLLPNQQSPSAAYGTTLPSGAELLFATKLSKETRKKLRKKESRLSGLGLVTYRVAANAQERRRFLDAVLSQKIGRFRTLNITSEFETPEMHAFIERASAESGIELHALMAGERIVAVYGGAAHDGQWSGMFNSFDNDDEIAKSSPGDLLLMRIIAKACADGATRFDLGIGEARYKATLCDETIPLFDAIVPVTPRGRCYANLIAAKQSLKRAVKQNARLFALAKRVHARLR